MQVHHFNTDKPGKDQPQIPLKDEKLDHALTQVTVNDDCTRLVTADTAGRLKLWDISKVNWLKDGDKMSSNMREVWFIKAHKSTVNQIVIVETYRKQPLSDSEGFLLSCGNDCNIVLHRLTTGQKVGQFGQSTWNIKDVSGLRRRPNFDRDWLIAKKEIWFKFFWQKIQEAAKKGLITIPEGNDENSQEQLKQMKKRSYFDKVKMKQLGFVDSEGEGSLNDPTSDNEIVDADDFISEEEDDESISKDFKGKAMGGTSSTYKKDGEKGSKKNQVDEDGYSKRIQERHDPEKTHDKFKKLWSRYQNQLKTDKIKERFEHEQQNTRQTR